ncbi:hypothetical protein ACRALDRAFT_1068227 [Sodiomyces alcalophilus JCM 7366]|uniref:uncharacterized protein n=1 Tax=Sodiomyces alcalophilus JCM 7366 TaxID=591952 RepID=UPI0039B45425
MAAPSPSIDLYYRSNLDRSRNMDVSSPKRASMDRQTGLAQLKLVSKYYGYPACSNPRPEPGFPQDACKRPSRSYADQYQPELVNRTQDRGSIDSAGSPPSLIDDRTDSELSHDDDYQYHASTSQIWDSFWVAAGESTSYSRQQEKQQQQNRQQHKLPRTQEHDESDRGYPVLIPSPDIKRTKKSSAIHYDDSPFPPKPAGYALTGRPPVPPKPPAKDAEGWPLRNNDIHENRKTIRAVKSSYNLFPKQTIRPCPPTELLSPPPRTSSLPRVVTPTLSGPSWTLSPGRKASHSESTHRRHHHSATVPQIPTSYFGPSTPAPPRPHTSHGTSGPRFPDNTATSPHSSSPHLSDPTDVTTSIPLFPSTNLVDLVNPRSAPSPPRPSSPGPSIPVLAPQKSFFDFDSDSESEAQGRFSRLVRGKRHKHSQSATAAQQQQQQPPSPTKMSRKSVDRARSRPHATTTTTSATTSATTTAATTIARRSHEEHEGLKRARSLEEPQGKTRRGKEGRRSDVFGRMFGRSGRGG